MHLDITINGHALPEGGAELEAAGLQEWAAVEIACAPIAGAADAWLTLGGQRLGPPTTTPFDQTWRWRWQPGGTAGEVRGELGVLLAGGATVRRAIALRLLPRAIDQRTFEELLAEIGALARALALQLGGPGGAGALLVPVDDQGISELERALLLVERHADALARVLGRLAGSHQTTLRPSRQRRPSGQAGRLRDIDPSALASGPFERPPTPPSGPLAELAEATGGLLPAEISGSESVASADLPENRFAAGLTASVRRRALLIRSLAGESLARHEGRPAASAALEDLRQRAEQAARRCAELLSLPPLAGLRQRLTPPQGRLLRRDRRYRPLLVIWTELRSAPLLALRAPDLSLPIADMPTLYERWSALTVCAALLECGEVRQQQLLSADSDGWTLQLERAAPLVEIDAGGLLVWLRYQPRYKPGGGGFASLDRYLRIPDLALELGRDGLRELIIFDAKYRLAPDGHPPQDALDDIYAYRSSLGHDGAQAVRYAALLYPGRGAPDDYGDVGALPHLPGRHTPLRELLARLLATC